MEGFLLCQLQGYKDSKFHPECKSLKKLLRGILGRDWFSLPADKKAEAGKLYMPCLSKEEIEEVFESAQALQDSRVTVWDSKKYWDDDRLVEGGTEVNP